VFPIQKYRYLKPIYKWRGYFYIPPLLVMAFCFWNEYENDLVIWSSGLLTMALSLVIRVWATKHIGRRISRKYKNRTVLHLVTTGPYSLVRNPLYIGNILAIIGLCILSELVWFMPIVFAYFVLLYSLVARYEEYKLSVLFGEEYEAYRQTVPSWIPRFSMIRWAKGGSFSWARALRGELPGVASSSVMILILLGKEIIGW
jgi:protein-S-isoprenylcysteine O-methyltransferase Ste14